MSNEQDNIAFDAMNQATGQHNALEVGQDEGTEAQENSTTDWEAQAKYHQSEKDKLFARNQELEQYEKIGKFLESRPDVAQTVLNEVSGQPKAQEARVALKPDEFDPWEAYNDPSSKSYIYRMQEMQETINGAVDKAVGGIEAQQGRTNLRTDLANKGLNDEQMDSFFEFADKHPSEYGLDNVLKMWQAVSQPAQGGERENPLDKVRQTQSSPQAAGVLQGQQPKRKSEDESMWEGVLNSTRVGNRIP
jgi:hypothetical protein